MKGSDRRNEMATRQERATAKRRDVLRLIGLGSVASAASLAAGAAPAPAGETPQPETQGYRETAHVKKFYETAKF
jgi:hypothetical protein